MFNSHAGGDVADRTSEEVQFWLDSDIGQLISELEQLAPDPSWCPKAVRAQCNEHLRRREFNGQTARTVSNTRCDRRGVMPSTDLTQS